MSARSVIVLVLALICGISAAVGMTRMQKSKGGNPETVPVLVAKTNITRGHMLVEDMIQIRDWPKSMVPEGALATPDDALERAALLPIIAGDVIMEGKLASKDSGRGMAALVPPGMRAYTIQTSKLAANVAGFILPGNRVDVLLTLRSNARDDVTGGGSSTTLLQAVEILAVDQRLDAPVDNKVDPKDLQSVTLLVTPKQVGLLDLGQNMGQLTLSLRNPEDTLEAATEPATVAQIRFREEKPTPKLPHNPEPGVFGNLANAISSAITTGSKKEQEPKSFRIRTFRGNHQSSLQVEVGK